MPNPYKRLLEETLKQKVSEAAEQLMKSISQEIDAELRRDMIGSRIYYEDREAGERWLRMESQKQESSAFTLRRHLKWDGDVLKVQDTMHDVLREAAQAGEDAIVGEILDHFDCDLSDFREYMHDKIRWEQKQWAAIPHWIPVTERLPEVGEDVLIYAVDKSDDFPGIIAITDRMIFRLFPSSEGVETWRSPWQYFMTDYKITHWMPLPSTEGLK